MVAFFASGSVRFGVRVKSLKAGPVVGFCGCVADCRRIVKGRQMPALQRMTL